MNNCFECIIKNIIIALCAFVGLILCIICTFQSSDLKLLKKEAIQYNHAYYTNDINGNSHFTWNNITNK